MPAVLLVGTYSSKNKGDAAMELSAATAIRAARCDATVTISTPFPQFDRDFYAPLSVVASSRRRLIWGSLLVVRARLWRWLRERMGWNWGVLVRNCELSAYLDSDLVVDLSGDMLTEDYGPHVAYSHFIPILLAWGVGRQYCICAQSVGPFKVTRWLARRILHNAAFITVRDHITLDYLRELMPNARVPEYTADLAFLLEPARSDVTDAILAREEVPYSPQQPILGVSLSQLVEKKFREKNPHRHEVDFVELIAGVLDAFCEETGLQPMFISHVTGPTASKDDRLISRRVEEQMRTSGWVLRGDYGPRELKALISRCHMFVGARMHANIAALSSAVPTVAIAYSHKTPGIMEMFDQSDLVCTIERMGAAELHRALTTAYAAHDDVSTTIARALPRVHAKSARNIDRITDLLK